VDPLNILSRPARAAFLLVLLAIGGVTLFVFAEATWEADAQAGLIFGVAAIYTVLAYVVIAAVDNGLRAIVRRMSGARS
jgi:hypothetical protein